MQSSLFAIIFTSLLPVSCVHSIQFTTHIFLILTFPLPPNNFMQSSLFAIICTASVSSLRTLPSIYHTMFFFRFVASLAILRSPLCFGSHLYGLCVFLAYTPLNLPHTIFFRIFFSYLQFHADLFILHFHLRLVSFLRILPSLYHTRLFSLQFFPFCFFLPAISCGPLCSCIRLYGLCLPCVHSFQFTTHIFFLFFFVPVISCGPLCFCVYLCGLCLLCVHFLQFSARVRQSGRRPFAHSESCTSARSLHLYVCIYMFIYMYICIYMRT